MRLLYYSPASYGGISDYAHEQANAMVDLGVEVHFLCTPEYPTGRGEKYNLIPILAEIRPQIPISSKLLKYLNYTKVTLSNYRKLGDFIVSNDFRYVLLGYSEYLAPLWFYRFKKIALQGVNFGAVVHDPIRDFVLGPLWWHRWSMACAYSFLQAAFVHESIDLDVVRPVPGLKTTILPFGVYSFPDVTRARADTRANLNLPNDKQLILAFGHIRDNKNLDLVIQAMVSFPNVYLLVAGKEQSSGQKPVSFYQNLAESLGVASRCRWHIGFIPDEEVANLFEAADLAALTYSSTFRSASSALSIAANYHKPCLVSSGQGHLKSVVSKYQLGVYVEPDSVDSIIEGINKWLTSPPQPQWEKYFQENSWLVNAKLVVESFD
jgi:glycosyltransferase involved in cell wall biosynthesis